MAKVIFLQLSVIHSVHMGGCLLQIFFGGGVCSNFSGGVCSKFGGVSAPNFRGGVCSNFSGGGGGLQFSEYGQRSAGTHPTGMHSCHLGES